ncbi:hypothetical protein DdX_22227 [Ditylenchus destructor]|uniref:Uncharacterized protein n=1 Tax=Ditylenchus destructor TaxID=166010 RepID=A0AAD4MEJ3_9BILA|nr:hypothetical protein DdX_22227 [Ditylenchus destructor]
MITAVGGTAGPPTGHMVIAGALQVDQRPVGNCPRNPLVRTKIDRREMVVARPCDFWSKDRMAAGGQSITASRTVTGRSGAGLLDPRRMDRGRLVRMKGGDMSRPIAKPKGGEKAGPHGMALSDDFSRLAIGASGTSSKPPRTSRPAPGSRTVADPQRPRDRAILIIAAAADRGRPPGIASNAISRSHRAAPPG